MDGLRALAAVAILVFHLDPAWLSGGFIGVDIFFVISGFLITGQIVDQGPDFRFRAFYRRRVMRLWPALIATIIASCIAGWFILSPRDYAAVAAGALSSLGGVSNIYFYFTQDYFTPSGLAKPLLHLWSLSVEEQFYLVWPALLLWGGTAVRPETRLVRLLVACVASLVLAVVLTPIDASAAYYMMPTRAFAFALGGILRLSPLRLSDLMLACCGWGGAAALAGSLLIFSEKTAWPSYHALVPSLATAMLIAGRDVALIRAALEFRPLAMAGRASYSIYLVHWPLIAFASYVNVAPLTLTHKLLLFLATLGSGALLYVLIERPFRLARKNAVPLRHLVLTERQKVLLPSIVAGVAAVAGVAILTSNGAPVRLAKGVVQLPGQLSFAGDQCNAKFNRCAFGDPDSRRIVYLIGDSHALNLVAGLDRMFKAEGIKGIGLYDHGCLFLADTLTMSRGVPDKKCARNVDAAFAQIAGDHNPVILTSAYIGYNGSVLDRAPGAVAPTLEVYPQWLEERLSRSLARMGPRPVLLIGPAYDSGIDMANCLSRAKVRAGECVARSRAEMEALAAPILGAIKKVAKSRPETQLVDPVQTFCDEAACRYSMDNALLLRDTSHLTNEGSYFIIKHWQDELHRLIR